MGDPTLKLNRRNIWRRFQRGQSIGALATAYEVPVPVIEEALRSFLRQAKSIGTIVNELKRQEQRRFVAFAQEFCQETPDA